MVGGLGLRISGSGFMVDGLGLRFKAAKGVSLDGIQNPYLGIGGISFSSGIGGTHNPIWGIGLRVQVV